MFKPLIVIPLYNHLKAFKAFLPFILKTHVPILVVDDGSQKGKEVADFCAQNGLFYQRLPHNRGKGAALKVGFEWAFANGYSHLLQIDADGQHNAEDIPAFLQKAQQHPLALINGHPLYDEHAPKSRLYGRKITNFWVMCETKSRVILDAMCGFRVYPVALMMPILKTLHFHRMGFDIEIIVKAFWAGLPILHLDTTVFYPTDGVSHFKVVQDNLTISLLHTLLFCQSLLKRKKTCSHTRF